MSVYEFKLPDIGEGVMEGEIVAWHVEAGQAVAEDQPMVDVMTDKATVTIGAPKDGTIGDIRVGVGDVVPVGSVIVTLQLDGAAPAASAPAPAPAPVPAAIQDDGPAATAVGDIKETLPGTALMAQAPAPAPAAAVSVPKPAPTAPPPVVVADADVWNERPLATPATRKLARDLGVALQRVRGTGAGGRITKDDVLAHRGGNGAAGHAASPSNGASAIPAPASPTVPAAAPDFTSPVSGRAPVKIVPPDDAAQQLEERTPFVGVRRRIAERMQTTKNTAAHFTFVEECDVEKLQTLRARMKPAAKEAGVKLTFLPFIVKACVAALRKHPVLNSALDETTNELVTRRYYNIGIAASTDQGLMVPVVKNADRLSLLDIAREIERLGTAAREGTIQAGDLRGSTFTITSLGKEGGLFATPVLNFPEVGILGVHRIKERPVVRDGAIEIGQIMLLSLSFDHRIVDGHVGAAFAYDIIRYLEEPDALFLEMA